MPLSEQLQELRKKNSDSQEQLAEKLGVSRQAVSKWESGQGSPDLNNIIKISEVYQVSIDYIVKGVSNQQISTDQVSIEQICDKPPKRLDSSVKKAFIGIMVFAGVALVGVLFLSLLTLCTQLIVNL